MVDIILVLIAVGFLVFGVVLGRQGVKAPQSAPITPKPVPPPPVIHIDLESVHKDLRELPNKVLQSIQNSSNTQKGALGELIGFIRLQAEYDRIIPLGNIIDFVCIKLPGDYGSGIDGCIDFIDVKTGKNARLSKEQRGLRELIKNRSINFIELKIEELSEAPSQRH